MQGEHRLDFGPATVTSRVDYSKLPSQFDAAACPGRNPTSAFGTASRFKKIPVTLIGEEPGPGAYTVSKDRKGGGSWVTGSLTWHKRVGKRAREGGKDREIESESESEWECKFECMSEIRSHRMCNG
jgi:hypothetical protein